MYEEEVLLCTQKMMMLLINMHKKGMLSTEAFYNHTYLKVKYLEECSIVSKFPTYSVVTFNILACYRNILEVNPVAYKTRG